MLKAPFIWISGTQRQLEAGTISAQLSSSCLTACSSLAFLFAASFCFRSSSSFLLFLSFKVFFFFSTRIRLRRNYLLWRVWRWSSRCRRNYLSLTLIGFQRIQDWIYLLYNFLVFLLSLQQLLYFFWKYLDFPLPIPNTKKTPPRNINGIVVEPIRWLEQHSIARTMLSLELFFHFLYSLT